VAYSDFDADYQDAFRNGIVTGSNGTIAKKQVQITDVSDAAIITGYSGRRKLTDNVLVKFNTIVIIEKYQLEQRNAFAGLSARIRKSTESIAMQNAMNTQLAAKKGVGFTPVAFSDVGFEEQESIFAPLRTAVPSSPATRAPSTDAPTKDDDALPVWLVSMVASASALFLCIAIGSTFYTLQRRGKLSGAKYLVETKKLSRVAVEPLCSPLSGTNVDQILLRGGADVESGLPSAKHKIQQYVPALLTSSSKIIPGALGNSSSAQNAASQSSWQAATVLCPKSIKHLPSGNKVIPLDFDLETGERTDGPRVEERILFTFEDPVEAGPGMGVDGSIVVQKIDKAVTLYLEIKELRENVVSSHTKKQAVYDVIDS
jgi:hypothetical protein